MTGEQLLKDLASIAKEANAANSDIARQLNGFRRNLEYFLIEEEVIDVR